MTRLSAAHRTLADLEREARNARESEMRLIHEASLARETGTVMPEALTRLRLPGWLSEQWRRRRRGGSEPR